MSNVAMPIPTEAQEAEVLVAYLRIKHHKFTHIGNETGHSPEALRRAVRLKRQGVSRGFPDYLIIVNHQLIAVELKRLKGGRTTTEQTDWIRSLIDAGVPAKVCAGADEAINFVQMWEPYKSTKGEEF